MEIIFTDKLYGSDPGGWEEGIYSSELASQLSEFDKEVSATDTDIGHGADWPVVLVEIFNKIDWSSFLSVAGLSGLFFMGENINKNIDAWLEIAQKLKKLIEKFKPVRVDEKAAILLVLNDFFSNNKVDDFDLTLQIIEFTPVPYAHGTLGKRPDALYIISVKTESKALVYGIKSNLKLEFKHEFKTEWLDF